MTDRNNRLLNIGKKKIKDVAKKVKDKIPKVQVTFEKRQ
jgi:hypothetical protein